MVIHKKNNRQYINVDKINKKEAEIEITYVQLWLLRDIVLNYESLIRQFKLMYVYVRCLTTTGGTPEINGDDGQTR